MKGISMIRIILSTLSFIILIACSGNENGTLKGTGTIEATEVTISSQISAPVLSVRVREGAIVNAGDTLLVLDSALYKLQLHQGEAALAMAEAEYEMVKEGPRTEDIIQAEANYANAVNDLTRIRELYESRTVSEKQLDDAQTRKTLAEQTLRKLKEGARPQERRISSARVEQARAQVELLRDKLNDCFIVTPRNATITNLYVEEGELANPATQLLRISDLSIVKVTVYVSMLDLPQIRLGQKAIVTIDGLPGTEFKGKVTYIASNAEFTPKNIQTKDERTQLVFAVRVEVPNLEQYLKPGLPADVAFPIEGKGN